MKTGVLMQILSCPTCRKEIKQDGERLYCPGCGKDIKQEGRLLDFGAVTPHLPLAFEKYSKKILAIAGEKMSDVPINWRVVSVLNMIRRLGNGKVCLEIGGADGPMTPTLESLYSTVLTLDAEKVWLKRIEAKTDSVVCLYGDAHFLPIADRSVDTVVCSEVLEHALIPTQLLLEIRRVLKSDGRCVISVPDEATRNPFIEMIRFFVSRREQEVIPTDSHVEFYNSGTLKKLLSRMGFEIVELKNIFAPLGTEWSFRSFVYSLIRRAKPSYVLCCVAVLTDPDIYWDALQRRIAASSRELTGSA